MASSRAFLLVAAVAIAVAVVAPAVHAGTTYTVGGDNTKWMLDFNYQAWADTQHFFEGDTLVFNYPIGVHNVIKVTKEQLEGCQVPDNPESKYDSGSDEVVLVAGENYFICGFAGHCDRNMKITITAVSRGPGTVTIDV